MFFDKHPFETARELTFAGVPDGCDALLVARLLESGAETETLLHIAEDDAAMTRLAECLAEFAPDTEILTLPAWDCLPYDRVPPHSDIVARRKSVV